MYRRRCAGKPAALAGDLPSAAGRLAVSGPIDDDLAADRDEPSGQEGSQATGISRTDRGEQPAVGLDCLSCLLDEISTQPGNGTGLLQFDT